MCSITKLSHANCLFLTIHTIISSSHFVTRQHKDGETIPVTDMISVPQGAILFVTSQFSVSQEHESGQPSAVP
jgi:hypothetical protein